MSLASTDPSDIANAARCFSSCITGVNESAVKTYLLTDGAGRSLPPCVTPGSAFQVGVGTKGTTDTNTQLGVHWLQQANAGSLITSYTVYWGTTAGGPYTFNSGPVPVSPKFYLVTGLTAATTYYFVVVANAFSGCSSANSAEANATTTGAPPIDPAVTDWEARVIANGGADPSAATLAAADTFWKGVKADGIDSLIISLNFIAPDSLIAAITPFIKGPGNDPWTNSGVLPGDLTINGLGPSFGNALRTGVVPSTAFANNTSAGMCIYKFTSVDAVNETDAGCTNGFASNFYMINSQGGSTFQDCWSFGTAATAANNAWQGWVSGQRTANNLLTIYKASSGFAHASIATNAGVEATARPTVDVWLFCMNNNGVPTNGASAIVSFFAITLGLTAAQDTLLFNRVQTLRVTLGGGFR